MAINKTNQTGGTGSGTDRDSASDSSGGDSSALYGAVEAGGTKFVVALGRGPGALLSREVFPTTNPAETLERVTAFFREAQERHGSMRALGVGSFGPVDCRPRSPSFGWITSTPKPGWRDTDLLGPLRRALGVPVGIDTDVNAAALAEWRWGCARGRSSCLYVTVGTGVGGGFVLHGRTLQGLLHPEMGHVRVKRLEADVFPGNCPFHGAECLEGLASGPALENRWRKAASELPPDHRAWEWQADYLAQALVNWILTLTPEVVALGGGVMQQEHLFPPVRRRLRELLNDYVRAPQILQEDPEYIRPPGLGTEAGILGALAVAEQAAEAAENS